MLSSKLVNNSHTYLHLEIFVLGTFKIGRWNTETTPEKDTWINVPFGGTCVVARAIGNNSEIIITDYSFCFNFNVHRQGIS